MNQTQQLNCDDFLRGQRDCQKGAYKPNQGDSYNRGYAAQYELEQVQDALGGQGGHN